MKYTSIILWIISSIIVISCNEKAPDNVLEGAKFSKKVENSGVVTDEAKRQRILKKLKGNSDLNNGNLSISSKNEGANTTGNLKEEKNQAKQVISEVKPKKVTPKKSKVVSKPKASTISTPKVKEVVKEEVKKMARIIFDNKFVDFGELVEGDIREHEFVFTNEGDAPLSIIGAEASCGCATPTIPFLDIAPGEQGRIGIKYNSVSKIGAQEPQVKIKTNATNTYVTLKMAANVVAKEEKTQG